ncbi:MAG TPA: Smr/MutS family protein [Candidatus Binataceae bacterium]|nr:Smr/MutS family protein [Candidatus Binataceae bacterium]
MAKKRKPRAAVEPAMPQLPKPVFESPFKELKKLVKARSAAMPAPPPVKPHGVNSTARAQSPEIDDATLLREALAGVRRFNGADGARIAVEPRVSRNVVSEDAEVLAQLSDLVSGQTPFELTETEEYVEGARVGLDPRVVTRLRRGEFSMQGHLDLHGMIQPDAKEALGQFIVDSVRKGLRAVAVVHGRGLRSPGGQPVLKHAVAQWLSHGLMGGYVLAFTTAQAYDGGAGAVWILLRRERKRGKFDILQGAKRRD